MKSFWPSFVRTSLVSRIHRDGSPDLYLSGQARNPAVDLLLQLSRERPAFLYRTRFSSQEVAVLNLIDPRLDLFERAGESQRVCSTGGRSLACCARRARHEAEKFFGASFKHQRAVDHSKNAPASVDRVGSGNPWHSGEWVGLVVIWLRTRLLHPPGRGLSAYLLPETRDLSRWKSAWLNGPPLMVPRAGLQQRRFVPLRRSHRSCDSSLPAELPIIL